MPGGQMNVFDITMKGESNTEEEIKRVFKTHCKKWAFKLEKGEETGFIHWQCRINLGTKLTKSALDHTLLEEGLTDFHTSITSNPNKENTFYIVKKDTAIGPLFTDKDVEMPWDLVGIELRHWQQFIVDNCAKKERRYINVIFDKEGGKGKSLLAKYIGFHGHGHKIPGHNNMKDFCQYAASLPVATLYIVDLPRGTNVKDLPGLYTGIETLKDGMIFDGRYKASPKYMGSPMVWVFCNELPKRSMLSEDRWKWWTIENEMLYERDYVDLAYVQPPAGGLGAAL